MKPGEGEGHWRYAVRVTDPDDGDVMIYDRYSSFTSETFYSAEEAWDVYGYLEGAELMRRWIPKASEWEPVPAGG